MTAGSFIKLIAVTILIVITFTHSSPHFINSFKQLGEYHCDTFPVEILFRLSSGTLAEKYGSKYAEIDCYVRQFVNKDGQNIEDDQEQQDQSEQSREQQSENESQVNKHQSQQKYQYDLNDPIVIEYSAGLAKCIPENIDEIQAVYQIWRFYRYLIQHDYLYEWMRAKIRSGLGYQAERPSSWMDGETNSQRLRLDKLFSNEFYDYVDKLMFKDFLAPLMMFLKKNVVIGVDGEGTESGYPILMQFIESRNIHKEVFKPIIFSSSSTKGQNIFTYTLPGIPLFLGGSSSAISWAYTGVLVDRSNIQQIQTVGNKFYHDDLQEWIKLDNVSISIPVKDYEPHTCTYMHSSYGTLYEKHNRSGKVSEYIARWHEDQERVRNLFSETFNMIVNKGNFDRDFDFPFNSIIIANNSGIYNYLCQQRHPSYFIYPDLASQPDPLPTRWVTQPKKNIFTFVNTHLSTINQNSYLKKQVLSSQQQQIIIQLRRLGKEKFNTEKLWQLIMSISTDPLLKKRKEHLIFMYRKAKFVFFPEEQIRKQCDQLISIVQKWNNNLESELDSVVFILWDYYFRQYTMNHVSSSEMGKHIVKHKVLTDNYWTNQPELWKKVISYGECDSNEWFEEKWNVRLNNTGLNSTCFYNIMRAINKTREILMTDDGRIKQHYQLSEFKDKKLINLTQNYKGNDLDEIFGNFYSKNMGFVVEINNQNIKFLSGYDQQVNYVNLNDYKLSQQAIKSEQIINKQDVTNTGNQEQLFNQQQVDLTVLQL